MPSIRAAAGNRRQRRELEREIRKAYGKLAKPVFVRPSQRLLNKGEKKPQRERAETVEVEVAPQQEVEDLKTELEEVTPPLPEITLVIPANCRAVHLEFEDVPNPDELLIPRQHLLQHFRNKGVEMWLEDYSVVGVEPKTRGIISWDKQNREKHRIEPLVVVTVQAKLTRRGFGEKSFSHDEFRLEYSLEEIQRFRKAS